MPNRISFSKINLYQTCPKKYDLQHNQKIIPVEISSSLFFGGAVDKGLNELLVSRDISKAINVFEKSLKSITHNGKKVKLSTSNQVAYLPNDLQQGILLDEDNKLIEKGNRPEWVCLRRKGIIMIESYADYVLPQIQEVLVLQKKTVIKNEDGDELEGTLDLVVKINGKIYLLDHKTSSSDYLEDAATYSQQLSTYYQLNYDEYKFDGVGFIVLKKNIWERKEKSCSVCGFDGSGSSFRTCNNLINNKRCDGEWIVKIFPKCFIDIILNDANQGTINLAMDSAEQTNKAIKEGIFPPNFNSCRVKRGTAVYSCPYFNLCHHNSMEGLTVVKEDAKITKKE